MADAWYLGVVIRHAINTNKAPVTPDIMSSHLYFNIKGMIQADLNESELLCSIMILLEKIVLNNAIKLQKIIFMPLLHIKGRDFLLPQSEEFSLSDDRPFLISCFPKHNLEFQNYLLQTLKYLRVGSQVLHKLPPVLKTA